MYVVPSGGKVTVSGPVTTIPGDLTPVEWLAFKKAKRLDRTSTPGVIYIGEAPISTPDTEANWILSRWNGTKLDYAQALGAWTDRLTTVYGV